MDGNTKYRFCKSREDLRDHQQELISAFKEPDDYSSDERPSHLLFMWIAETPSGRHVQRSPRVCFEAS